MNGHSRLFPRSWILALVLIALVGGHGILFYVFSHEGLAASVASGLILLVVIKHPGLLSPLYRFTQCSAADFVIDAGDGLTVATSPLVGTLNQILISNFRPAKVPPLFL